MHHTQIIDCTYSPFFIYCASISLQEDDISVNKPN